MTLVVDAGDEESLEAVGTVSWCKPRQSPLGKTIYEIGLAFDSDWLAQKRGPLGTALARIFAMNSVEPARSFERTPVALQASAAGIDEKVEIIDMSLGGLQLRAAHEVSEKLKLGSAVIVEIDAEGNTNSIDGTVVWVAANAEPELGENGPRLGDAFGVRFEDASDTDRDLLDKVRLGNLTPDRITIFLQQQ
jgi:hypothetical protein